MIDPLTAMTIIQAGMGVAQKFQAQRLERDNPRPEYKIPEAQLESLNNMRHLAAQDKLPGHSAIQQRMDRNTANQMSYMLEAADNPTKAVQNAGKMAIARNDQEMGLGIRAAEMQQQNRMRLSDELKSMATEEVRQWNWNKRQPWEDAMLAASELNHAGNMNMYLGARAGLQLNYDKIQGLSQGERGANRGKYWDVNTKKSVDNGTKLITPDRDENPDNPYYDYFKDFNYDEMSNLGGTGYNKKSPF